MIKKMKLLVFLLACLSFSWAQPNWDYVNFPSVSNNWSSKGAAICPTQEVYSQESNIGGTYRIVKYANGSYVATTSQFPAATTSLKQKNAMEFGKKPDLIGVSNMPSDTP